MDTKESLKHLGSEEFKNAQYMSNQAQDDCDFINMQKNRISKMTDDELTIELNKYIGSTGFVKSDSISNKILSIIKNEIDKRNKTKDLE